VRAAVFGGVGAALGLGGYAGFIEPNEISVTQMDLRLPGLPEAFDGFRIVQLSDLHYGPYTGAHEIGAAVRHANALAPDTVVVTGDFVTSPWLEGATGSPGAVHYAGSCARLLARLQAHDGVYACLGNHDAAVSSGAIAEALKTGHLTVLRNQSRVIERGGARLWIAAVGDVLYDRPDMQKTLAGIPANDTVVLLAHEPDYADVAARYPLALQLSGHSHGGQIRLPLLGATYLPALARKYPFGYYRVRNMHLYTSRGIGTIVLPLRFGAPPELTLFRLRPGG
jgi:uncharacterized protein